MTDLQISLVGIGAAIVIGVIIFNKVQEYRARKDVERAFSDSFDDVLMKTSTGGSGDERKEPVIEGDTEQPVQYVQKESTSPDTVAAEGAQVGNVNLRLQREPLINELIDCTIPLNFEEPVRGEKIFPLLQTLRYTGNKPVHYMGLIKEQDERGEQKESWEAIMHGGVYHQLHAGVQLANRASALSEIEYSELVTRLRQLCDGIGAEPDLPDMSDVIQSARSVFQFVSEHDAKLGVNIRTNGAPWAIETLMLALERQGFESRTDRHFVMRDVDGEILFSLSMNEAPTSENVSLVTLLLDVPSVPQEKEPFNVMVQCAKSLCTRLDGSLVDDGNQVLTEAILEEIAGQVTAFYEEMKAASIPAGSILAHRLFN